MAADKAEQILLGENLSIKELERGLLFEEFFQKVVGTENYSLAEKINYLRSREMIHEAGRGSFSLPLHTFLFMGRDLSAFPQTKNHYVRLVAYRGKNRLTEVKRDVEFFKGYFHSFEEVCVEIMSHLPF